MPTSGARVPQSKSIVGSKRVTLRVVRSCFSEYSALSPRPVPSTPMGGHMTGPSSPASTSTPPLPAAPPLPPVASTSKPPLPAAPPLPACPPVPPVAFAPEAPPLLPPLPAAPPVVELAPAAPDAPPPPVAPPSLGTWIAASSNEQATSASSAALPKVDQKALFRNPSEVS